MKQRTEAKNKIKQSTATKMKQRNDIKNQSKEIESVSHSLKSDNFIKRNKEKANIAIKMDYLIAPKFGCKNIIFAVFILQQEQKLSIRT